jgi:hypothetical protein
MMMVGLFRRVRKVEEALRPWAVGVMVFLTISSGTLGNMAGFGIGWFMLMGIASWRIPVRHVECGEPSGDEATTQTLEAPDETVGHAVARGNRDEELVDD